MVCLFQKNYYTINGSGIKAWDWIHKNTSSELRSHGPHMKGRIGIYVQFANDQDYLSKHNYCLHLSTPLYVLSRGDDISLSWQVSLCSVLRITHPYKTKIELNLHINNFKLYHIIKITSVTQCIPCLVSTYCNNQCDDYIKIHQFQSTTFRKYSFEDFSPDFKF